jgi:hypothetical protein
MAGDGIDVTTGGRVMLVLSLSLEYARKFLKKRRVPNQIPDEWEEEREIPQSKPAADGLVDRPGRRILQNLILLDQLGEFPLVRILILALLIP